MAFKRLVLTVLFASGAVWGFHTGFASLSAHGALTAPCAHTHAPAVAPQATPPSP